MSDVGSEILPLLRRAAAGEDGAWREVDGRYRTWLRRTVTLRLDRRAQGRIDPSDVVQEAMLEASRHLADYLQDPKTQFRVWLRAIARHKLLSMLRHELGAEMRDPRREVSLHDAPLPEIGAAILADRLIDSVTGPVTAVVRAERQGQLQQALEAMEPLDREVLALRHFEQLSNNETAEALGIEPSAASKRYIRALHKLRTVLSRWRELLEES